MTQTEVSKQPTRVQQSQEHINSINNTPQERITCTHGGRGFRLSEQANCLHLQAKKKKETKNKTMKIKLETYLAALLRKIYQKANRKMQPMN